MPGRRPTPETLESLRATLLKLEQTDDPPEAPKSISELKRILLNRIAELEILQALETSDAATDKPPEPAELVPPPLTIEEDHLDALTEGTNLDKLD